MAHKKLVTAVFRDRYDAERAFDYLHAKGYMDSEINVLMSDRTRSTFYPLSNKEEDKHKAGTMATEGMGVGGALGTAIGATINATDAMRSSLIASGIAARRRWPASFTPKTPRPNSPVWTTGSRSQTS